MTRARKALMRAKRGYREAVALRDPVAISASTREYANAHARVQRQEEAKCA